MERHDRHLLEHGIDYCEDINVAVNDIPLCKEFCERHLPEDH